MKTMRTGFSIAGMAAAILLLLFSAPAASAQYQDSPDQGSSDQDPPTRAGRIGYVEGSVSFQPGGEGDWVTAVPNRPLTVGDNLWVDRDSRAEIQIGSTSIRLAPETSITILNLANEVTQLRLSLGSVIFRVRHFGSDDALEVDTPNLAFNVGSTGEYRLDVNENGDQTTAEVFQGEGEITGAGNSYRLMEGQRGTFSGVDQLSYDVDQVGRPDDFYHWARSRDERQDRFRSAQYVSTEMTGYEDLDDYGRWENVSGYGYVWSPVGVPYGWAPYRYGHWAYIAPWGWTWVEDEPWGFAPFHYGRWAYLSSRWCWVPGPVVVRPVYAPALVAFIGGSNFSIGIGVGGGVGWFPLAPGEVYVPWYRTSPRYVQNVNVTNTRVTVVQVTNVYNTYTTNRVSNIRYVNQRVTNSVTVVNHDTFVNARPVNRNVVRVDTRQIQRAQVAPAVVRNFQPQRQSVIGVARPVNYRPPREAMTRPVIATRQPVIASRPMEVPNVGRVTTPPIRTVRAVPVGKAQPLQRGARGKGDQMRNEAAPRPGAAEGNRQPAAENNRANPRPNTTENNPGAENHRAVPRPGASENRSENSRGNARGNRPENNANAEPRPGNRENQPAENNPRGQAVLRPNAPDNNPGLSPRNNPNPPASPRGNEGGQPNREAAPRESSPDNQPGPPENRGREAAPRPSDNPSPQTASERPRGNSNGNGPENAQPQGNPHHMDQSPRAPEVQQAPPQRSEARNAPAPRQETHAAESQGNRGGQAHGEGKGNGNGNGNGGQNRGNDKPPHLHFR